ncbi:MAG: ribosome maturation factor RimM [Synergistaceae bacterium]|nr:ribosome maturation factor RimM [Synergistaceae bacterium]
MPEPKRAENAENGPRTRIGLIVGAHGLKGTLRIHPLTDYPERFFEMERLYIERPGKPPRELEVLCAAPHAGKGQILVKVAGIDDCDEADKLTGWLVTVANDDRVSLPEGEYWIDTLIGMDVVDMESGEKLGSIADVFSTGSNDVYQVRTLEGDLKLIPAIADVVRVIDQETGLMKVTLLEGLWD